MAYQNKTNLWTFVQVNITDPLLKQNTALRVRNVLKDIIDSYDEIEWTEEGIIANPLGGQLNGTQLTEVINCVDEATVANASVKLPPANRLHRMVQVENNTTFTIMVFPTSSQMIKKKKKPLGINVGVPILPGGVFIFRVFQIGIWRY